jgi:hypothetical protein
MIEIVEFLQTPDALWLLLLAVLLFGVPPGLVLRLLLLIYPKGDPRRRELRNEMKAVPYVERWLFVGEQFETVLVEGVPHRVAAIRQGLERRRAARSNRVPTWSSRAVVRLFFGGAMNMTGGYFFMTQPAESAQWMADQGLPIPAVIVFLMGMAGFFLGAGFLSLAGHEQRALARRAERRASSK